MKCPNAHELDCAQNLLKMVLLEREKPWVRWSEAFVASHSPRSLALLLALGVATGLFPL
jgi:hypothetical protein